MQGMVYIFKKSHLQTSLKFLLKTKILTCHSKNDISIVYTQLITSPLRHYLIVMRHIFPIGPRGSKLQASPETFERVNLDIRSFRDIDGNY